jgi:hypothetical protein
MRSAGRSLERLPRLFAALGVASMGLPSIGCGSSGPGAASSMSPGPDADSSMSSGPDADSSMSPGSDATPDPNLWTTGKLLATATDVPAGTTVTIAPGAVLTARPKVLVTVHGTLKVASAAGAHARIGPAVAETPWEGILVAAGGTLDVEGLDLDGATTGLDVRAGSLAARYDKGTISAAVIPFVIDTGARLDTSHAAVVGALSTSGVNGELHASYLDYAKIASTGGFVVGDPQAVFDVSDSTLHGEPGLSGGDYVTAISAKLVRVTYTTITDAHCGFHFDGLDHFEIDHVTVGAASPTAAGQKNAWGAMLYGSGPGASVITDSNFMNRDYDLDQMSINGPLTITRLYTTAADSRDGAPWVLAGGERASAPNADAHPR